MNFVFGDATMSDPKPPEAALLTDAELEKVAMTVPIELRIIGPPTRHVALLGNVAL